MKRSREVLLMIAAAALGGTAAYFLWHAFVPHLVRSSNLCS